jgi:hypothetical protein
MSLSLIEYRTKLITKIMFASSQDEVKQYIDTAMKSLEQNKLNDHIITRFTDKMLAELESFNPMNKEAKQWSNIKMARIWFNQIKRKLEKVPQQ